MTETEPQKRSMGYLVPVLVLLLLGAFLGYQYQKRAIKDPDVRFKIAHEALMNADDAKAFRLFSSLAKSGDSRARYWLGDMYENGYGIKKDIGKALALFKESANQGEVQAEARLGEIYLTGETTVQNFVKARQWLQKSADRGNARAERLLGHMEEYGLGGEKDIVHAYAWYQLAVLGGDGLAVQLRDGLLEVMSSTQINEAQAYVERLSKEVTGAQQDN